MSFSDQTCQQISDTPGYMPPCPACSFLDRPDGGPDLVVRPNVYRPRAGRPVVMPCCALSRRLDREAADEAAIVAEWMKAIRKAAEADRATGGKITATMQRLERKGFLPTGFNG
jgi:hypothetical protein